MPRPAPLAVSRRSALISLGAAATTIRPAAAAVPPPPRRLLLLWLSGGASQLETFDPKPGASTGGPFRAVSSSIPGTPVGELLPHVARNLHRLAVVRSVRSDLADHFQAHYAVQAGRTAPGYPVLGAAVAKLLERPDDALPGYVALRRSAPKAYTDVGDAGFLGAKYDAVRIIDARPPDHLQPAESTPPALAELLERTRRSTDERFRRRRDSSPVAAYDAAFQKARALMRRRDLFDLEQEPAAEQERYGRHEFGRHCLLARRLLEAGVRCVKVTHFDWDAHQDNFYWHQIRCAEFDRTFIALLDDLERRGLLESTLVVVTGEMGRTPRINNLGGRDHWGSAWSMAMAGCGVKPGVVLGSTTPTGEAVLDDPVSHADLFHTYLRALGIDSRSSYSLGGVANPIADPAAKPIDRLLA